ncbi:DHH family phosphoesterase [Candidatus Dojkabacteria bacterium]|nr:DHH family phosphoesterase [Candidatus Dojkabacteria bacterium]
MKENKVLITAKINPDLDGVASGIGYAEFLNKTRKDKVCEAGFEGDKQIEVEFALSKTGIEFPLIGKKYDSYILVDFSALKGLPTAVDPERVDEFIDHRSGYVEYEAFINAKPQVELVGAAATLIAEKFFFENIDVSDSSALLLYLAIFSNSLYLKAQVTTFRDKRAVRWLEKRSKECNETVVEEMFEHKTNKIIGDLEFALESDAKQLEIGGENIGIYQLEVFDAERIIKGKVGEIIKVMKKSKDIDWAFCTIADVKEGKNYLILGDKQKSLVFKDILEAEDKDGYLITESLFLRKEIIPRLQEKLN